MSLSLCVGTMKGINRHAIANTAYRVGDRTENTVQKFLYTDFCLFIVFGVMQVAL